MVAAGKALTAGTRVKIRQTMAVPGDSVWDDDHQRTSTSVKRRLQQQFFMGDKRVQAEILYVASESVRAMLKRKNQVKLQLRDPAGSSLVITACVDHLKGVA
jgi:hypothetical protein